MSACSATNKIPNTRFLHKHLHKSANIACQNIVSSPQSLIVNSSSFQPSPTTSTPDALYDATLMPTSSSLITPTPLPDDYWMPHDLPTVSMTLADL
jgi:hypothetical protein